MKLEKLFSPYCIHKIGTLDKRAGNRPGHTRSMYILKFNLYNFLIITGTVSTSCKMDSILLSILL